MGLPGSGKSTLAEPLANLLGGVWINADIIRSKYNDWDFSYNGRVHQAYRMKHLADGIELAGKIAVADFICPTEETRKIFSADYTVWMNTINSSKHLDTDAVFEKPTGYNYHVAKWFDDTDKQLMKIVTDYIQQSKQ